VKESDKQGKKRGGVRKKPAGKQKRPRRRDFEYPYLEPSVALLKRREEVDDVASYAHKLSAEDKAWMNQFMKEYNDASTQDAVFHTTAETRKICNDKNNARNRCWYSEEAAANRLNLVENDHQLERLVHGEEQDLESDDFMEWIEDLK
jgi:hypothetical protein